MIRLRLLGFKSFVDPTDLVIERGLTGVVGPNGCGKSNLLEALRWVMGETSHKSMRAAAMDDVIFSGTNHRPPRNVAEVTVFIDNSARRAPAEWNDNDVIEITRRIEREAGSAYRINSKEVRARDVRILFEDAATGARSPALVRQGQIGEIVNAKPEARRRILEDAAGVAGLHSRRHDAELRLKAAEQNLERLNDVLGGLNSQIESLKRQARAARRYKEISGEIRRQEALLFHLNWVEAQALVATEEANLAEALDGLAVATEAETKALTDETRLAELIPPLREEEARRAAVFGRLRVESDAFEREAQRTAERERELKARAEQLERDIGREENFVAEAREIIGRLDDELITLEEAEGGAEAAAETAAERLTTATDALAIAERELARINEQMAERRARRQSLEAQRHERQDRVAKIERQLAALEAQAREVAARAPDVVKLSSTAELGQSLSREISDIETRTLAAEEAVHEKAALLAAKREASAKARLAANAIKTERETLVKVLVPSTHRDYPPVEADIRVAPGYEKAIAAALGEDLDASLASEAPLHWRLIEVSPEDASLPADAEPLIKYVDGPPELTRRLKQIGIIDRDDGANLQPRLKPGQRLVSRQGDLWRWDGFIAAADVTTAAAQRLAERNRLATIDERYEDAELEEQTAREAEARAVEALGTIQQEERALRQLWRETQTKLAETRDALTLIERSARETETRLAAIAEARIGSETDLVEARERLGEIDTALALLEEDDDLEPLHAAAGTATSHRRHEATEARAALQAIERDQAVRIERIKAARIERERWGTRLASAEQHIGALRGRLAETVAELEPLAGLPALIAERRQKLLDELSAAEAARKEAADTLTTADNALKTAITALRAAQAAVSSEREGRARIEARLEGARTRRQDEARKIREALDVAPEGVLALAEVAPDAALPALPDVDRQLTKLRADRERLGGVNLQADDELTQLNEQFARMDLDKLDVEQAVAKLRGAIQQLNREAKKRLNDAFQTVNGHFQRLFQTLFQGGEARLEMIESEEDPLEGGLEIIARPPGKKPATMSLLSGGEQTLTALSLIFAVFLTNPSPICVLDEVDAPLDDANVDRFCTLLEKMASETETRFLIITHHPMTMARMNRLFGVTMAEKGISQLVSVDLETAQSFREADERRQASA